MGTVKPVPRLDLKSMLEEGYHPSAYVLSIPHSVEAMKIIAEIRKKNLEKFNDFDKAIMNFAYDQNNYQSSRTMSIKHKAYKMIEEALPKREGATLHFCGSTMTKCGSDSCDIDLCWAIPAEIEEEDDELYPMYRQGHFSVERELKKAGIWLRKLPEVKFTKFISARVDILKIEMLIDGTKLPVDININNIAGVYNTFMVAHYAKIDERFYILARVLKVWGKHAGIIDSYHGYLNSYTIILMVLHFLQCGVSPPILPNLIALRHDLFGGELDLHKLSEYYDLRLNISMEEKNHTPIGDLLIGFLRYYGMFDYDHDGIILRMGCVAQKPNQDDVFFLEEVYDRQTVPKNLSSESMDYIKCTFLDAFLKMQRNPDFDALISDEKIFMPRFKKW